MHPRALERAGDFEVAVLLGGGVPHSVGGDFAQCLDGSVGNARDEEGGVIVDLLSSLGLRI